ncbi:hypothetical protein LEP1GSC161_4044 [Leptospira santarosai str. CBC1416]|uniref:Uncharacterized protein n=2 Tax=Leptospira santarosai TaxID=28183 RepID=K8YC47_9LEPT|nr:hypothetical protein LEP1GSC163_1325 [Leptospira santarosai str. CBC379]EKT87140.1 hypothetical protein LSS_08514 [Leptospira santarosai serovar Shermani str. LT 821]EMO58621.1 hypothetical protein LEP1GSC161_4044 [Leptospira santarosai str. CBC1416]
MFRLIFIETVVGINTFVDRFLHSYKRNRRMKAIEEKSKHINEKMETNVEGLK